MGTPRTIVGTPMHPGRRRRRFGSVIAVAVVGAAEALTAAGCTPTPVPDPVIDIAVGGIHTCDVHANVTVRCWGYNADGELGNGTTTDSLTPVAVSSISGATKISAGERHSCAIVTAGAVMCWGLGTSGRLGAGSFSSSTIPVTVSGLSGATEISVGDAHTCVIVAGGAVRCWGEGSLGRLGNDQFSNVGVPATVPGITNAVSISAGSTTTCAALSSGTVKCWGNNDFGALGTGSDSPGFVASPLLVSGISTAFQVSVGFRHACAVLVGNTTACWGDESLGALDNGVVNPGWSNTPLAVSGLTPAAATDSGSQFSCASLALGGVNCWGRNDLGQLGDGTTTNRTIGVYIPGA